MRILRRLRGFKRACGIFVMTIPLALTSGASGVIFQFEPATSFNGPPVQATFQDIRENTVLLTITMSEGAGGEFLDNLYFNFDPADNLNRLHFKRLNDSGGSLPGISKGADSFQADGGYYDIDFGFSLPGEETLSDDNTITYQVTGPGLTALDFAYPDSISQCGELPGTSFALAEIQGDCGNDQWLAGTEIVQPVPEPDSVDLLTFVFGGLLCALCYRQREEG